MEMILYYAELLGLVVAGLVMIATVIVNITPDHADNKKLDKFVVALHKAMAYLPTLGRNPMTKKIYAWYDEQQGKK